MLLQRMSVDAPSGDMTKAETTWTAERVRERDRQVLVEFNYYCTVARHRPTGEIVGVSELAQPRHNPVALWEQWNTIVLPAHRGRRLGLLVKAANLVQLPAEELATCSILTWNAEENRHMLRVNEQLGFREILRRGGFEKRLSAEG